MGQDIRGTEHARCFGDKATETRLRWSGHIQRTDSGSGRGLGRRAKRRVVDVVKEDMKFMASMEA